MSDVEFVYHLLCDWYIFRSSNFVLCFDPPFKQTENLFALLIHGARCSCYNERNLSRRRMFMLLPSTCVYVCRCDCKFGLLVHLYFLFYRRVDFGKYYFLIYNFYVIFYVDFYLLILSNIVFCSYYSFLLLFMVFFTAWNVCLTIDTNS